ncbi:McrC family protein [Carboxylicivirga sp. N1Y90]|uniref:McrC family protein n=1 Tax=Carboxylicivirga fragile TaxID=3417571 RepID=UPI003D356051|nr:hypothetical protein [Marinilabiliaceae bacterium N1Y90]
MIGYSTIQVFEHERLLIGNKGFKQKHLDALLKLNELHDFQYFDPIYGGLKFKQYVGVIQVDGLCIEILPKADKHGDKGQWQKVLIHMLKACGRLKPESAGGANVKRQHLNLLEVYFELFLNEVDGLIRRGLVKQYRKHTGQVKALKGKLEFAGQIRHNLVHQERFYTSHQVYDQDHLLHQVLNTALEIVGHFTKGTSLYDKCKRVQLEFPEVSSKQVTSELLERIKLNRKTAPYSYPLEIARLIILNYSPDISSGQERMLSLLFDMNQLWEEYVLVILKKTLKASPFVVTGQETKPFWNYNYLQPDIVIQHKETNETFIIDTKWKQPGLSSASVGDLRQMYAYNRFWNAKKAMLLYPGENRNTEFKYFLNEGEDHSCKMGFVSVVDEKARLNVDVGYDVLRQIEITPYHFNSN